MTFRSRELAFLRVVAERSGELGWYGIEQRLAGREPYTPSAVELQRRLGAIGATATLAGDRYAVTKRGRDILKQVDSNGWLLGPAEANDYATELAGPIQQRLPLLAPFLEEPSLFPKIAHQLHAAGLPLGELAWCTQLVVRENRSAVAFELLADAPEAIRIGLFHAWGGPGEGADDPARFKPPGPPYDWSTDPMFVELLTVGLSDGSPAVRDAAARLAYLTQSGLHVANDLLANLASPTPSIWSAAALGTARDDTSLAMLRTLVARSDERMAGAAVRALAARLDGRAEFLIALRDDRDHVRWTAEMSLGEIATDLSFDELASIQYDATDETRRALAYYDARHRT